MSNWRNLTKAFLSDERAISAVEYAMISSDRGRIERAFLPGVPETEEFPFDIWTRLASRIWRRPAPELLRLGKLVAESPPESV